MGGMPVFTDAGFFGADGDLSNLCDRELLFSHSGLVSEPSRFLGGALIWFCYDYLTHGWEWISPGFRTWCQLTSGVMRRSRR